MAAAPPVRLLLLEDATEELARIGKLLADAPGSRYELTRATSPDETLSLLGRKPYDAVLVDATRLGWAALADLLPIAAPTAPVVVVTRADDAELGRRALAGGAQDHVVAREIDAKQLARALRNAIERHRAMWEPESLRQREGLSASLDPLTGLPNRGSLQEHLRSALAEAAAHGTKVAVLSIDLDSFKSLNDTLGQAAGVESLRCVAERLRLATQGFHRVARMGGY